MRRIARKYAIDLRLAQLALAKTERQRHSLAETRGDLERSRARLAAECGEVEAPDLAAANEWQGRIAIATQQLDAALVRVDGETQRQQVLALCAKGRADLVDRKIQEFQRQMAGERDHTVSGHKLQRRRQC